MNRGEILDEAKRLTHTDRQKNYGSPYVNHKRIADLWSPIFGVTVTPEQVALAMIQVKVAREINRHTRDNLVDLIGYTLTLDACREDQ
jgi:hypothetical protein